MTRCQSNYHAYPIYTIVLCGKNLPATYRPRVPDYVMDLLTAYPKPETPPGTQKSKLIQTMYRDSEAQTDPYVVDVAENDDKKLEILTLDWMSWNHGLPAGMHEVFAIERARQKRAWENALPLPMDPTTREIRRIIIEAMEINEWNYREDVIGAMASVRAELAKKLLREKCQEDRQKYEDRLNKYIETKRNEKINKIEKLRSNFNRQVRKLVNAKQKINLKYHRVDIIQQFTDPTSELYAPLLRYGEDPRHWHEVLPPQFGYWQAFKKLEIMHQTVADVPTSILPAFNFNEKSKPKKRLLKELCIRSTKWTEQNLEQLHDKLRNIRWRRYATPKTCYLKKKVRNYDNEWETPAVAGVSDEEEDMFQTCLFLQKVIKGRAIQAVMFEGRVKCQELIEELKSTHALQSHKEDLKGKLRRKMYGLQRKAEIEMQHEKKVNEILAALEGKTTGDMLDFLSKELLRLQNERETHRMALQADQERHKREAAEAGRRQLEEQRKREHEEMLKQIMKMHQNSLQSYLADLITNNSEWLAQKKARECASDLAKNIDEDAYATTMVPLFSRSDDLLEEELIADLIHNFALPEVEKRIVRERIMAKQKNYLKVCHDEVYSTIESVTDGKRDITGKLIPLARFGKHKIPPLTLVKYRQLKRMHESSSSTLESGNSKTSASSVVDQEFSSKLPSKLIQAKSIENQMWSSGFSKQDVVLRGDEMEKN